MLLSRLADRGSEVLTLYPEKTVVNDRGISIQMPDLDNPVTIAVSVSTGRQSDSELVGQVSTKVLTLMCRTAPVGSWALVKFRGEYWDIASPPTLTVGVTSATSHVEMSLRSRSKDAA